ncbi:MAG: hypothetical protein J2P54_16790 [Bradyrhizobiaceae bacterium]|nr:hypothetical protein [Bradyrhizobiaceae bacterium]
MGVDYIRYDILAQEALRGLVRTVLADTAAKGLPGDHHFFITFDTRAEGVRMSPRLRAQHPSDMTIVLQHQFWDLTVTDDGFGVGLSFNGIPENLVVPWSAITDFVDPSVQFGLKFAVIADADKGAGEQSPKPSSPPTGAILGESPRPPARHEEKPAPGRQLTAASGETAEPERQQPDKPEGGGEVVRLDRFRKK